MADDKKVSFFTEQPKQRVFIDAVKSGKFRYLCLGGSIRSAKTYVCLAILIFLCKAHPGSRWAVIRRDTPTLKRNTLPTFFRLCPPNFLANFNKSDLTAQMTNGSEILFMGEQADKDTERERFGGLEINGALCEQIEELQEKTFNTLIQRIGQWPVKGKPAPSFIIANCNPTQNWVKTKWYDPWAAKNQKKNYYFQIAKIIDNSYNSEEYLDSLKDLPQEIYDRFVEGLWDAVADINQLVPWEAIKQCKGGLECKDKQRYLGVDVGRMGPDPTVFVLLEGQNIIDIQAFLKTRINEVSDKTEKLMMQHKLKSENVCIDAVGLGAGVVDNLYAKGYHKVIPMSGGDRKIVKDQYYGSHFKFYNWKAWSYWYAAEQLKEGKIGGFKDETLVSDTAAIWYYIKGDKITHVESKEDLKKRIGRSCDYWDAFVYAVWASRKTVGSFYSSSDYEKELEEEAEKEKEEVEAA